MELSVVVELDNARVVGIDAAVHMLSELGRQSRELPWPCELLIVHDPHEISADAVELAISRSGLRELANVELSVHAAPGARYYGLKNVGSQAARGALVLQTDGDIVIEPGFLANHVAAFADPAVQVTTGATYVGPLDTFLERTVALCWHFPVRPEPRAELRPTQIINGNSVAARRAIFLRFPFVLDARYRGACQDFGAAVRKAGITTWENTRALAMHPTPGDWLATARRALWQGYDRALDRRAAHEPVAGPVQAVRGFETSLALARRRIAEGAKQVGARPAELPAMVGLAAAYEVLVRAGYAITRVAPQAIPTVFER